MKIAVTDYRKISTIQDEFSHQFPYLKIEFYKKTSVPGSIDSKKIIEHPAKKLGQCRAIHKKGSLAITPEMSVTQLEQAFQDAHGLSVEIFRKSGNTWLETSVTDGWPLEKQNRLGEMLSSRKSIPE